MSDDELLQLYSDGLDREVLEASKNCESSQCVGRRTNEVLEDRLKEEYPLDYEPVLKQPLWVDLHDESPLSSEPIESKPHTPRLTAPQARFLRGLASPCGESFEGARVTRENEVRHGVPMLDGKRMTCVQSRLFRELERKGAVRSGGRVTSMGLRALEENQK